jgi:hypothetical protein
MSIETWYFAFHAPRAPWQAGGTWYSSLGHVEAFGYTKDDTWVFFDPQGRGTTLVVTHLHDEVEDLMAEKFQASELILRIPANTDRLIIPYRGPLTCVSQCASLMGWRAYSLGGFRRKLLANGAEVIHGTETKGRERRGQESTAA